MQKWMKEMKRDIGKIRLKLDPRKRRYGEKKKGLAKEPEKKVKDVRNK